MRSTSLTPLRYSLGRILPVLILTLYAIIALFPIVMIIMNSFKARKAIFGAPFAFPTSETFSLIGSDKVEGTNVYGADGEEVGYIERVMIDTLSGKVS